MEKNNDSMNFKLSTALKESFQHACKSNDRQASQVIRDLLREYIERQKSKEKK